VIWNHPLGVTPVHSARRHGPSNPKEVSMTKTHSGWVTFAGVMLFILGVLNVIYGIAAIGDSRFFIQDQKYILSNLNTWGWVSLIIGALQLFAAFSLWSGGLYGRFVAILAATLSAFAALLSIPAYPFWSLAIFAVDIIIIYQVAMYGGAGYEDEPSPERTQAARRDIVT
jgi:hypothetical protein